MEKQKHEKYLEGDSKFPRPLTTLLKTPFQLGTVGKSGKSSEEAYQIIGVLFFSRRWNQADRLSQISRFCSFYRKRI